jgi:hypothetical protein
VLSLWFLSHNLYLTHTLLESLSQLQWIFDRAKLLTQTLLKQGICCSRIEVIPSQVLWPSSRIDWPLWDVCVPNDNRATAVAPVVLGVRVSHLFFSFLVFDVQCLFLSLCVFLVPGFVFVHFHIRTIYKTLFASP